MIERAVAALNGGEVVCFPTETSYGLAVDIAQPAALARLVDLKGRSATAPIGLIVADLDQARALARCWPDRAAELATRYWPGPLTLVVPGRDNLPPALLGDDGGVGMRISSHPIAVALARGLGGPITATSANPTGSPAALSIAEARAYFGERVAVYVDGGECDGAAASTVVGVDEGGAIRLLRRGVIEIPDGGTRETQ